VSVGRALWAKALILLLSSSLTEGILDGLYGKKRKEEAVGDALKLQISPLTVI
jgi:hypothetical protein